MAHRTIEAEDVLKAAYALQAEGGTWDDTALVHSMGLPEAMARGVTATLVAAGWAEKDRFGRRRLTAAGKARARELVRAHRLWERYLIDRAGGRLENVHTEADRREREATPEDMERLDANSMLRHARGVFFDFLEPNGRASVKQHPVSRAVYQAAAGDWDTDEAARAMMRWTTRS